MAMYRLYARSELRYWGRLLPDSHIVTNISVLSKKNKARRARACVRARACPQCACEHVDADLEYFSRCPAAKIGLRCDKCGGDSQRNNGRHISCPSHSQAASSCLRADRKCGTRGFVVPQLGDKRSAAFSIRQLT